MSRGFRSTPASMGHGVSNTEFGAGWWTISSEIRRIAGGVERHDQTLPGPSHVHSATNRLRGAAAGKLARICFFVNRPFPPHRFARPLMMDALSARRAPRDLVHRAAPVDCIAGRPIERRHEVLRQCWEPRTRPGGRSDRAGLRLRIDGLTMPFRRARWLRRADPTGRRRGTQSGPQPRRS